MRPAGAVCPLLFRHILQRPMWPQSKIRETRVSFKGSSGALHQAAGRNYPQLHECIDAQQMLGTQALQSSILALAYRRWWMLTIALIE